MAVVGLSQYPNSRFKSRICPSLSVKHRFEPMLRKADPHVRSRSMRHLARRRAGEGRGLGEVEGERLRYSSEFRIRPFKQFGVTRKRGFFSMSERVLAVKQGGSREGPEV